MAGPNHVHYGLRKTIMSPRVGGVAVLRVIEFTADDKLRNRSCAVNLTG